MDSFPDTRLYEHEGLIISSASDDVDEPGVLDKMMGFERPGCYEECAMEMVVAAVGPGSTAQSPYLTLSSSSESSCCHCSSLEHQCTTPLKKKRIPNSSNHVLFEIPMTKRLTRQQLSF